MDGCEATATRTFTVARQPYCSKQCHRAIVFHSTRERPEFSDGCVDERVAILVSHVKALAKHAVIHEEQVESLMEELQAFAQQAVRQQEEWLHQQETMRESRGQQRLWAIRSDVDAFVNGKRRCARAAARTAIGQGTAEDQEAEPRKECTVMMRRGREKAKVLPSNSMATTETVDRTVTSRNMLGN